MQPTDVYPGIFGGLHLTLTAGAVVAGMRGLRRIERDGRADRRTLWRLAAVRILTGTNIMFGGAVSLGMLVIQAELLMGNVWPVVLDRVGMPIVAAWVSWFINAAVLDSLIRRPAGGETDAN